MQDGAVVQRGTPDDLYDNPTDLYVASKIGSPTINVVEVQVGPGGDSLDTPFGAVALGRRRASPGTHALMGIRPSDLRIPKDGDHAIQSRIHLIEPLGDVTLVSLDASDRILRLLLPEQQAAGLRPGDPFAVAIDPAKTHVFRAIDGSAMG
jgi:multiple sugar transport system ATP-binding protein